jgi:hypothetical protein
MTERCSSLEIFLKNSPRPGHSYSRNESKNKDHRNSGKAWGWPRFTAPPRVAIFAAGPRDVMFFVDRPGGQSGYTSVFDHFRRSKYLRDSRAVQHLLLTFALAYNNPAMDPNSPVVNVGTQQNPSYLIVDVCIILPGQPCSAKLSRQQTKKMIGFAVRKPASNAGSILLDGTRILGAQPATNTTFVSATET